MQTTAKVLLGAAVAAMLAAPAWGSAADEAARAQNKLLAERAARSDAIRKLAERITGLHITSETYVKDFVAESDEIRTALNAWLSGMKEVGKPKHMEDGTCEVVMEVTLEEVVKTLKRFRREIYKGDRVKIEQIDKMTETNEVKVLRETGQGAVPEAFVEDPLIPTVQAGSLVPLSRLTEKAKAYWLAHCSGRGRLMAERAARLEGMRRLAERIKGVHITSETTVRDFVAESDDINVSMDTFLRGARERGVRYHADELIVEVEMQVKLRTVYMDLKTWGQTHYKGDKTRMRKLEELSYRSEDTIVRETGMGVPPAQYLKDVTAQDRELLAMAGGVNVPEWVGRKLRATGQAAVDAEAADAAQAKLMAARAAELDARRKLAEKIDGLNISTHTTVQDFVAQSDEISTAMLTFQQGASVVEGSQKYAEDGTCQVDVEIELKPLWNMILHYKRTLSITIK